eukprot:2997636-Rhodomonas_salina.1
MMCVLLLLAGAAERQVLDVRELAGRHRADLHPDDRDAPGPVLDRRQPRRVRIQRRREHLGASREPGPRRDVRVRVHAQDRGRGLRVRERRDQLPGQAAPLSASLLSASLCSAPRLS